MCRFNKIKAVSFDVGGTLIDPWPSVGHIYAEIARKHGVRTVSPEELNLRFMEIWKQRQGFDYSRDDWAEIVDKTFAGLTDIVPSKTFFDELWARFDKPDAWQVYDDVLPTIKMLKDNQFKLAVISNWDSRLRPLLNRLGLSKYFDPIVISFEVGVRKPATEIFHIAAAKLQLHAETILHVGDSPEDDFAGARAAGFNALLLDRSGCLTQPHVIRRLTDLSQLLSNCHKPYCT